MLSVAMTAFSRMKKKKGGEIFFQVSTALLGLEYAVGSSCVAKGSMNLILALPQPPHPCDFSSKHTGRRASCLSSPQEALLGEERKPGRGMEGVLVLVLRALAEA